MSWISDAWGYVMNPRQLYYDTAYKLFTKSWKGNSVVSDNPPSSADPVNSGSANDVIDDGDRYPNSVSSDPLDWRQYFNEAANLAKMEQGFNADQAELARNFNAQEADKARSFNAQQALEQREFEERMANSQYQRAVADMAAAGLNPYLVYAQGGNAVPSGAVASGMAASGMAAQSTNFSSAYLDNMTKLSTAMINQLGGFARSALNLLK